MVTLSQMANSHNFAARNCAVGTVEAPLILWNRIGQCWRSKATGINRLQPRWWQWPGWWRWWGWGWGWACVLASDAKATASPRESDLVGEKRPPNTCGTCMSAAGPSVVPLSVTEVCSGVSKEPQQLESREE
jgi:hypothetical protein